jgi:DNA-3-methyladenine glycosylase
MPRLSAPDSQLRSTTGTYNKLKRQFYDRPTLQVARDIVGKHLVFNSPEGTVAARIVETEAYIGQDDAACHAARGKTRRNEVMFGRPGFTYVYFIYGMYYCLNFVTESKGKPAAVLIRAAEPVDGIGLMQSNSPGKKRLDLLSGPGKLCRSFGLTREQNGLDLTGNIIYLEERSKERVRISTSPRIGINQATEHPWRFFDAETEVRLK